MSLALEHYRAIRERASYPDAMPVNEAMKALGAMLTETQQLTLSQMPTSTARQLGSILFSHEGGFVSAYSALNPPTLSKSGKRRLLSVSLLLEALSLLTGLGALYFAWNEGKIVWGLFILCSILLSAVAYFLPRKGDEVSVSQSVDTNALFSLAERRMEAIDRDLDAFLSIPSEGSGSDDSIVRIITLATSMKREDPDSVPDELMTAITALSITKGYEFLEYTPDNEALFDTMPTKRATRTIVPAVVRDKQLISRGLAIVSLGYSSEDK